MDLERIAVVLRPRRPWEAVDLGFALARAWWRPVYAAWFATVLPVWVLVSLALYRHPGWALLVLWWLRPMFDRVPLFVLSRALFGAAPTARETLRQLPRLWGRQLLGGLLVQRLNPARSLHLPVYQLEEGLTKAQRRQRTRLLSQDGGSHAVWTTFACFNLELASSLALLGLIALLEPHPGAFDFKALFKALFGFGDAEPAPKWAWPLWSAMGFTALSAIEPFYVAGGFSLYLSRRTQLEGWDVEIAFRRLAARLAAPRTSAAALLLLALLGAGSPSTVAAQPAPSVSPSPSRAAGPAEDAPARAIKEVLAEPELATRERRKRWRPKNPIEQPERPQRTFELPAFLGELVRPIALVLAAGLAAVLILLVARHVRGLPATPRGSPAAPPAPATLFGLDLRPASLPDDVPGAAWALWENGEKATALGLLYRGALVGLVQQDGLPIRESWTEGDCLRSVIAHQRANRNGSRGGEGGRTSGERAESFARLTRAWQAAAYAHRAPAADEMQALCGAYRRHFGKAV